MSNTKIISYPVKTELYDEDDFLKDCPNSKFIPTTLPAVKRIIAIGDIHGDLKLAIDSFKLANLIDDNYNWIADPPDTVVVQVGDQIDSCRPIPNVYECNRQKYPGDKAEDMNVINFFDDMKKKAQRVGGEVYSLFGNHELMNSQGRFQYVSYENYNNFEYDNYRGPNGRKNAFKPGGPLASKLACNRSSVIVIGSTMFAHAGVLPVLAKRIDYLGFDSDVKLKYLNAVVRKWLLNKLSDRDKDSKDLFINDTTVSPFWNRIYGSIPPDQNIDSNDCYSVVQKTIEVYKIGQIVVGHTPQIYTNKNGINGTCYEKGKNNRLYRVDGGFSRAFSIFGNQGLIQVLEIIDDTTFNIITDRTIEEYVEPTDININDRQMKEVAYIYSQNRPNVNPKAYPKNKLS